MCFYFLIFFPFFLWICKTRGWNWGWESEAVGFDIYRITHCQGTLLGLGSGSKGFAERRRPIDNVVVFSFFLLSFPAICTLKKTTGQTLSPPRPSSPPTSMRRILSQSYSNRRQRFLLVVTIYYYSCSNADTQFRLFTNTYFAENLIYKNNKQNCIIKKYYWEILFPMYNFDKYRKNRKRNLRSEIYLLIHSLLKIHTFLLVHI